MVIDINCEICKHNNWMIVYQCFDLVIVKCNKCSIVRLSEFAYEEKKKHYQRKIKVSAKYNSSIKKKLSDLILYIKNINNNKTIKLLDIGCGKGVFINELNDYGIDVEGLEPNPSFNKYHNKIPVKNRFIVNGLYDDNQFDIITLIQVLEHLDSPIEKLSILHKYIKPNGSIIINVPSYNNPRILFYRLTKIKFLVKEDFIKQHLYYYTPKTLSMVVENAGFDVYKVITGRYNIKFGPSIFIDLIDRIANYFNVGGILLYANKRIDNEK